MRFRPPAVASPAHRRRRWPTAGGVARRPSRLARAPAHRPTRPMAARRPSARVAARRAGGGEVERRAAGWTPATGTTEATMPMIRKKINYTGLAPLLSHDATACDSGRRLPCDATAQFFRPLDDAHSMRNATVFVVEAHDVVFAQVIPALHFDHYQRLVARIFQPVACLDRDEGRLVDQKRINA